MIYRTALMTFLLTPLAATAGVPDYSRGYAALTAGTSNHYAAAGRADTGCAPLAANATNNRNQGCPAGSCDQTATPRSGRPGV